MVSKPAAQQSEADGQVTLVRTFTGMAALLGLGEGTIAHELPFQCSTSVWLSLPARSFPTAQQSDEDAHATPLRTLF
jgi:hypothetical protein